MDEQGRALVNSDPAHWPCIVSWLSFGTVPESPSQALISKCKNWQLDKLLAAMQTQSNAPEKAVASPVEETHVHAVAGSHHLEISKIIIAGNPGFKAKGRICRFQQRLYKAKDETSAFKVGFSAAGRDWYIRFDQQKTALLMPGGSPVAISLFQITCGTSKNAWSMVSKDRSILSNRGIGFNSDAEILLHPKMVNADSSMPVELILTFP